MVKVFNNLFVSDLKGCSNGSSDVVVVHACKNPCHAEAVGYKGNLNKTHPNYLVLEKKYNLYLNMIDPKAPLFLPELFERFLMFAIKHYSRGAKVVIHCNKGESRSASLALLFMAKYLQEITNESYIEAFDEFKESYYPEYSPGEGIRTYLSKNWNRFDL